MQNLILSILAQIVNIIDRLVSQAPAAQPIKVFLDPDSLKVDATALVAYINYPQVMYNLTMSSGPNPYGNPDLTVQTNSDVLTPIGSWGGESVYKLVIPNETLPTPRYYDETNPQKVLLELYLNDQPDSLVSVAGTTTAS